MTRGQGRVSMKQASQGRQSEHAGLLESKADTNVWEEEQAEEPAEERVAVLGDD